MRLSRTRTLFAVALAAAALLQAAGRTASAAPVERLPDLRMESLRDFSIQRTTSGEKAAALHHDHRQLGPGPVRGAWLPGEHLDRPDERHAAHVQL